MTLSTCPSSQSQEQEISLDRLVPKVWCFHNAKTQDCKKTKEVNYFPVCSALEKMLSEWFWNETLLKLSLAYNVPHKHSLITFFPLLFICFNLISNCIFSTRLLSPTLSEFIRFKPSFSVTNTSSLFLCYSVISWNRITFKPSFIFI